jgi:uncharacterized pyridoxal phosphate-containing UPF0001 family protein
MALQNLACIQSVDSLKLAKKISQKALSLDRKLDIMLQLKPEFYYSVEDVKQIFKTGSSNAENKITYSWTKSGFDVKDLPEMLNYLFNDQDSLNLTGLMIIGEPGDMEIFKVMKNIKDVVDNEYNLQLGRIMRIVHGNEC